MRDLLQIQEMLGRFDAAIAAAGESDIDETTEAVREVLVWVVHEYVDDTQVTDYLS